MTVLGTLALVGRVTLQTARKIESKEELDEALRLAGVSFIESIRPLDFDEKILWSGSPSRMRFLWQLFVVIPFLIVSLIACIYLFGGWSTYNSFVFIVGACLFIIGIPLMGLLVYKNTNYLITNQRIITKKLEFRS